MQFFIPGKTKCAICTKPIENQYEATTLPYISPEISDTLSKLGRRFVHRECWNNWKDAGFYADAAYDLVSRESTSNSQLKKIFMSRNLILFWVEALSIYQLKDFDLLVTLDIPSEIYCEITNLLSLSLMNTEVCEHIQIGQNVLEGKLNEAGLEIKVHDDSMIWDKFLVPLSRINYWLRALKEIQRR